MRIHILAASVILAVSCTGPAFAADDIQSLKKELNNLKQDYRQRIQALEDRLEKAENNARMANAKASQIEEKVQEEGGAGTASSSQNSFNPAISLVLDGRYAGFDNEPGAYKIPGFALGGEAGPGEEGFAIGETELSASANVDDKFYGQVTLAIGDEDGSTEVGLEEAFIQTLGLGNGLTVKAGRFFSAIGYLNQQHAHAWDFTDAPLIYRGLFGNKLIDDGLQITYIAPTDIFLEFGAEAFRGSRYPAGGDHDDIGSWTAFANVGGDIGIEHSWQLGLSHWQADNVDGRISDSGAAEPSSFTGDSKINALNLVYKWAPNGNPYNRNLKVQFEYFDRREDGRVVVLDSDPSEITGYDGNQKGWYAQMVYQFMPQWRTGLRYDRLSSDNTGSDNELLAAAGLDDQGHTPQRYSAMVEWLPSEFSRIRLQFNRDDSYDDSDNQIFLQYTHSLGSHGAHQY
ncbi:MAG TPA: hypothetical protein ENK84_08350 [Desulfobulbus sp.]|nr:hypothetical protein [Desulfobulbus sp.]HHD64530.1 hypothetical protein [Desulfobulbaceae bacterium]